MKVGEKVNWFIEYKPLCQNSRNFHEIFILRPFLGARPGDYGPLNCTRRCCSVPVVLRLCMFPCLDTPDSTEVAVVRLQQSLMGS